MGERGAWPVLLALALAWLAAGCSSNVAIYGELEAETEPVLVVPGGAYSVSVGMLDEWTLLQWTPGGGDMGVWLDSELEPVGEPWTFGWGFGFSSRWVRDGDHLVGQVWADPDFSDPPPADAELVHLWRLYPASQIAEYRHVELPYALPSFPSELSLTPGGPTLGVGAEAKLPIVTLGALRLAAGVVPPRDCAISNNYRVFLAPDDGSGPFFPEWDDNLCNAENQYVGGHPWLFELNDGGAGLLFRQGLVLQARVRYLRLDSAGRTAAAPVLVGDPIRGGTEDVGFQPRGVQLPNGRILFTERRGVGNNCHALKLMNADGSGVGDAPWQLPCADDQFYDRWRVHTLEEAAREESTGAVELLPAPGGALLVYSQTDAFWSMAIPGDFPYEEGVFAVLIDGGGRRGSEIFRVSGEGSTARHGAYSAQYLFGAAVEADVATIAFVDTRRGIYVRRIRIVEAV